MIYHWTTKKNAKIILLKGLRKFSFVCKSPEDWHGEVLLKINYNINWKNRDKDATRQAITREHINPNKIGRLN